MEGSAYHWERECSSRCHGCWESCSSALKNRGGNTAIWVCDCSVRSACNLNGRSLSNLDRTECYGVRSACHRRTQHLASSSKHHEGAGLDGIDAACSENGALIMS